MMQKLFIGSAILIVLSGCSASHLIYVQETSAGLTISAGTEGTQKFSFGFDRDIFAVVPKKGDSTDAMSLFSINNVEVEGLNEIEVSEFVATGAPATTISAQPDAVNALRNKIFGQGN